MRPMVPDYLIEPFEFKDLSPSLQYGLYFKGWNNQFEKHNQSDKTRIQQSDKARRQRKKTVDVLLGRQNSLAADSHRNSRTFRIAGETLSPFATGLGNEHPLENGFSFLEPYGLPYLPGSSVKGVLRRAAEELVDENLLDEGLMFSHCDIKSLFGNENSESKSRGALEFWDVIIDIPRLRTGTDADFDVMTPHHGNYFKGSALPDDSKSPIPIFFLTIPVGSKFNFFIYCDTIRLKRLQPELLQESSWEKIIEKTCEHAFEWIGFGAKTAVGYGAMRRDDPKVGLWPNPAKLGSANAGDTSIESQIEEMLNGRPNQNEPETTFLFQKIEADEWSGDQKLEAAKILKSKMIEDGSWVENPPKNPKNRKFKRHQRTLQVKDWLGGNLSD